MAVTQEVAGSSANIHATIQSRLQPELRARNNFRLARDPPAIASKDSDKPTSHY
jgi:hypothetical protein